MRVAIVHYWLVSMRGGEKVVEALCDLYPEADVFTLVCDPNQLSERIRRHKITTSFIDRLPGGRRHYQSMLPLMPFALERLDLTPYDLVISSESGPAKGVITRPDALHLCYCHSPMRYLWDLAPQYYAGAGRLTRAAMMVLSPMLRLWDVSTAARVDGFIANSRFVAERIRKYYRRDSTVIHPPVDLGDFDIDEASDHSDAEYYVCAGQLVAYKRVDLAVQAFSRMGKRLVVIGDGPEAARLRAMAGPTIEFLGRVSTAEMRRHFSACRALIFPGEEDFGIVPLEVMACGRPVIAFGRGGARETVADGITGRFFDEQSTAAVVRAVQDFEAEPDRFADRQRLRAHAAGFSRENFMRAIRRQVDSELASRKLIPSPIQELVGELVPARRRA